MGIWDQLRSLLGDKSTVAAQEDAWRRKRDAEERSLREEKKQIQKLQKKVRSVQLRSLDVFDRQAPAGSPRIAHIELDNLIGLPSEVWAGDNYDANHAFDGIFGIKSKKKRRKK